LHASVADVDEDLLEQCLAHACEQLCGRALGAFAVATLGSSTSAAPKSATSFCDSGRASRMPRKRIDRRQSVATGGLAEPLPLENPTMVVPGDRVTHLAYEVSR
jgi:hypothetical protein